MTRDPVAIERFELALLAAENGDPEALRPLLAPAVQWHTPPRNLVGGDHMGLEQSLRFLHDCRDITRGSLRVTEIGTPVVKGERGVITFHTTATRGAARLELQQRVRFRMEGGRVAELWTEPLDRRAWDAFWAP